MRLDDYNVKEGKRVWLTVDEMEQLIEKAQNSIHRVAFTLGGKCGLRRSEIVSVTRNDFIHAPDGFVRVWGDYAKREKYREAPIPSDFEAFVRGLTEGNGPEDTVVDYHDTTIWRWVRKAAESLQDETGDRGWEFLDVHDLRRSWGGHLLWNCGVSPMVVMEFGGWEDWDTFKDHYMGQITPEAQQRERGKIDYLGGDPQSDEIVYEPESPAAKETYRGVHP